MGGDSTELHLLCRAEEIQPGEMRHFEVGRGSIALGRNEQGFFALRDICAHQGARLSAGALGGTMVPSPVGEYCFGRRGQIVRCPRHGFEYDAATGRSLHDEDHMRVRSYVVVERNGEIFVDLGARRRSSAQAQAHEADAVSEGPHGSLHTDTSLPS
jgi:nitrite reductase (NADH) small subunit